MTSPPRYLVYWINSRPSTRCALVNANEDLRDGVVLVELAEGVVGEAVPFAASSSTGAGRIRSVLLMMSTMKGITPLPKELTTADAAELAASGDAKTLRLLLEHLYGVWIMRESSPKISTKPAAKAKFGGASEEEKTGSEVDALPAEKALAAAKAAAQHSRDERRTAASSSSSSQGPSRLQGTAPSALDHREDSRSRQKQFIQTYLPSPPPSPPRRPASSTSSAPTAAERAVFDAQQYSSTLATDAPAGGYQAKAAVRAARLGRAQETARSKEMEAPVLWSHQPSRSSSSGPVRDGRKVRFEPQGGEPSSYSVGEGWGGGGGNTDIRTSFSFVQAAPPGLKSSSAHSLAHSQGGQSVTSFSSSFLRHFPCQELRDAPPGSPAAPPFTAPSFEECLLVADWLASVGVQGKVRLPKTRSAPAPPLPLPLVALGSPSLSSPSLSSKRRSRRTPLHSHT